MHSKKKILAADRYEHGATSKLIIHLKYLTPRGILIFQMNWKNTDICITTQNKPKTTTTKMVCACFTWHSVRAEQHNMYLCICIAFDMPMNEYHSSAIYWVTSKCLPIKKVHTFLLLIRPSALILFYSSAALNRQPFRFRFGFYFYSSESIVWFVFFTFAWTATRSVGQPVIVVYVPKYATWSTILYYMISYIWWTRICWNGIHLSLDTLHMQFIYLIMRRHRVPPIILYLLRVDIIIWFKTLAKHKKNYITQHWILKYAQCAHNTLWWHLVSRFVWRHFLFRIFICLIWIVLAVYLYEQQQQQMTRMQCKAVFFSRFAIFINMFVVRV